MGFGLQARWNAEPALSRSNHLSQSSDFPHPARNLSFTPREMLLKTETLKLPHLNTLPDAMAGRIADLSDGPMNKLVLIVDRSDSAAR
jgi:hypothetical protein